MNWFIFFLLKKKARIVKRKLYGIAKRIVDIFYALSDVTAETKISGLEDTLTISSDVYVSTKKLSFTDELRISDDVINALKPYSFTDTLTLSSDVFEAIKRYSFEDSLTISDSLEDVSKRQYNTDKLFVFSDVQQYSEETKPYSFTDTLLIYGDVEQLTEPIKRYDLEDTLTISDKLDIAKAKADVEDTLTISDDVKEAVKRYSFTDELRISDNVIESVRSYSFEDSLHISDSVTEAIKRYNFSDSLSVSDDTSVVGIDTDLYKILSRIKLVTPDVNEIVRGDDENHMQIISEETYKGNKAIRIGYELAEWLPCRTGVYYDDVELYIVETLYAYEMYIFGSATDHDHVIYYDEKELIVCPAHFKTFCPDGQLDWNQCVCKAVIDKLGLRIIRVEKYV